MSQGAAKERLRPFKPLRFGRYTLLMPLSTGGMGEIFLARLEGAQGFEKLCVIKKILPHLAQDKDFVDRFVDEARILVKLSHGNIAQVLDMGLHEGAPYIALEFIDGKDLRRVIARAGERALQLPISFVLYVTTRVLDALAYAHRKRSDEGKDLNLVHRDISPQNILISYEGEVKIIDFGLAKSTMSATHTHPSIVLGKFLYMAPEQARHQKADRRSDLYAVGLCLYELLTGQSPFAAIAPGELMAAVANPKIVPVTSLEPLCPPALNDAVMKALASDPAQRFQTAEELRGKLLGILLEIDPSAGPETATRFMTEAFATEYQSERRLLSDLKEQARALGADAPESPEETIEVPSRSQPRAPSAPMPALTLDEVPAARVTAPEVKATPAEAAPLSFQPTRKAPPPLHERKGTPVGDPSALPSIVVAGDTQQTVEVDAPQANVVLDDGLADQADARARTIPETRAPRPASPQKSDPARKSASRTTGSGLKAPARSTAPKAEPPREKAEVVREKDTRRLPARAAEVAPTMTPDQTPAPDAAPPMRKQGSSMLVWVALPLLAIAAVGGYILWDVYTERLRATQLTQDAAGAVQVVVPTGGQERSREVRTTPEPPPPLAPDELSAIPRDARKPTPAATPKAAADVKLSAGERALRALKADLKLLADEGQARKFALPVRSLDDRVAAHGGEASFLAEVNQLHAQVRSALDKPQ